MLHRASWVIANLANFLSMCGHMSATLLPLYWKHHGFEDRQIGWLAAIFSLAAISTRLPLGNALERFGRRPFLILGALLLNASAGVYGLLGGEFYGWLGIRLVQGIGLACYITAILTWVADRSPPDRIGRMQGVFGVSGLLGAAVGPYVAEAVLMAYGYQAMFHTIFAAGVMCTALSSLLPESEKDQVSGLEPTPSRGLRLWRFRAMILVTLPFGWITGTIIAFIAPFVKSVGLPNVGIYFAAFSVASVAVRVFAANAIDRTRGSKLVFYSGAVLALGATSIAGLSVFADSRLLILAALCNGIGHGFLFPGLTTYTVHRAGRAQRGAALALFTGCFDAGILFGGLSSGYVSQHAGYAGAFFLGAVLLIATLPFFVHLARMEETKAGS